MYDKEIIDLVSEDDLVVLSKMEKWEVYKRKLSNFRVVNVLIINRKNQIWVPRRHASKTLFPLALDCSVGGHVKSGESYNDAFIRESIEEVNIDPRKVSSEFLMKLTPKQHDVSAFMHVYKMYYDQEVFYNPNDFDMFYWLYPEEILQKIHQGDPAKSDLIKIIQGYIREINTI